MKKLLKEIFKSLFKTKTLIVGLIVLTFLSSGVFTLLNDVKSNYSTQFEDYKKVSKLHDLTVETDISPTGHKPPNTYNGIDKTTYSFTPIATNSQKAIRIPKSELEFNHNKSESFLKISSLIQNIPPGIPEFYIKTQDLYRYFQLNNIIDNIDKNGSVDPKLFPEFPFKQYTKLGDDMPTHYTLSLTDKINLTNIMFGDLINIIPGSNSWFGGTDDKITNVKSIFVNANTKVATISQSLKHAWEKQGLLITIKPNQVAKLLGFKSDGNGVYSVDNSLSQSGVFDLAKNGNYWRLSKFLQSTMITGGFSINLNNTFLENIEINNAKKYFVLEKPFKISPSWVVFEQTTFEYERYHSTLNYDFKNPDSQTNDSWTLNYKDYISHLTNIEQQYYSQAIYWKKTQIIKIADQFGHINPDNTVYLSQTITPQDLSKKITLLKINGTRAPAPTTTSILDIELKSKLISQASVDVILANPFGETALNVQKIINNSGAKVERITKIENGAKTIAQKNLYKEILSLVKSIQNVGLRESMTVQGFTDNNVYHFINGGNAKQEILLNKNTPIKQNVGKLYNETNKKSLLFSLSSKDDIKSNNVPQSYIFSIINVIFNGMSVDKNYINPIITFQDYKYKPYNNSSINLQHLLKINKAKIIRMKDGAGNIFGISKQTPSLNETKGKYFILTETGEKNSWISNPPVDFHGTDEDMQKFISDKKLNFANISSDNKVQKIVGPNGWAKQDETYSNQYSIPFQLVVPGADIIENWQDSSNFNTFKNNLIGSMSETVQPLIGPTNFNILVSAITNSFTNNGFSDVLSFPSQIKNIKLQKILFGIFYEAAKYNDDLYWNKLLDEILTKIINNNDPSYIKDQFQIISIIIKGIFGNGFDISTLIDYAKDPKETLIGLRKIIKSINIDQIIITIWNNFYDRITNTAESNPQTVIGIGDILPIVIDNIAPKNTLDPTVGFKAGMKDIINNLNFFKIINYLKSNVLSKEQLELFGPIIDQLNGNNGENMVGKDYANINAGFCKLIDLVDLNYFKNSLVNHSFKRHYFVDNNIDKPIEYVVNTIPISGVIASLLTSMDANDDLKSDKLNNAISELLNLSSASSSVWGIYQPESDPNKLDIRDLQSLLKSNTPKLNKVVTSLEELSTLLKNPKYVLDPTSIYGRYVTNYIFNYSSNISTQNIDIKKRVDMYLEFMSQTKFINFNPNLLQSESTTMGGNIDLSTSAKTSLADKFINMINPNTRPSAGPILDPIMDQVYNEFYNNNNKLQSRDMTGEILSFYSFWMKYSELNLITMNLKQSITEINKLVGLVLNTGSSIGKILNNTSKNFNPNFFINYPILDGFSNAKETAIKLANENPQNWLSKEALEYYFDYNDGKFVINNNTTSLVVGLSSIIDTIQKGGEERANLVRNDFVNMFLSNKVESVEDANIMLTLGQRTLNTLVGPANSIMENLGLSSTIMSPFSGVLNAPVILYTTINQKATTNDHNLGNMEFILKDRIYKFNSSNYKTGINYDGFKGIIDTIIGKQIYIEPETNVDNDVVLSLDLDYVDFLSNNVLTNHDTNKKYDLLGVNLSKALSQAIYSFSDIREDNFQIQISDVGSYVAKVNEAYLSANNKKIYKFGKDIPKTSQDMVNLLKSVDDKYKLNINKLEYLIIGSDSTVDYLYPVIDLNNIQVNTATQALVYVNQQGFDRAKESNANSVIDKHFLLIAPPKTKAQNIKNSINKYIYETTTGLNNYDSLSTKAKENPLYKKAFLYNETNPLKPELALRVQTIESLISTINDANKLISLVLVILIGIVTIFVIKRYVSSRSKVLGILKAQGYKSVQIAASICVFAIIVSIFGATLGYVVGHFLQIPLMNIFSIYWTLPIGPISFNIFSLVITVLMPLAGLILLTIITTLFLLRIKPTKLMDGSFELNNSKSAEIIKKKFRHRNIKSKFTLTLSLNSIIKLFSLFISLTTTVSIISFSLASSNVFGNAINKTYKNRKYNFKINLLTPTLEGGNITSFDNQDVNNILYVPIGNPNEGITYLSDYFKPGPNNVINPLPNNITVNPNGSPVEYDKHIVTKSSFDLIVNSGGVQVNVWNTLFNSMPDSQKALAIEKSELAAKYLEWTQGLWFDNSSEWKPKIVDGIPNHSIKLPYFKYISNKQNPEKSQFYYLGVDNEGKYMPKQPIIIEEVPGKISLRNKYREFLVNAYNKALKNKNSIITTKYESQNAMNPKPVAQPEPITQDYFLTFGSVVFNEEKNEKYSYATTEPNAKDNGINVSPMIIGYNQNSQQVQILDHSKNNLLDLATSKWNVSKKTVPIIINHVVKDKYNLNIGSKLRLNLTNNTDRFINSLKDDLNVSLGSNTKYKSLKTKTKTLWDFEIIGINETFINEEWTTSQNIINDIINLNNKFLVSQLPKGEIPFNGILSTEKTPTQATGSLGLYSENGYWAADDKIDLTDENLTPEQQDKNINIFKELFYKMNIKNKKNTSVFANTLRIINPNFTNQDIAMLTQHFLGTSIPLENIVNNVGVVNNSLRKFSELYNGNNILNPIFTDIKSKNIESGFISNATNSINSISTIIIVLSLLMTITILIMISTLIINENERNVAIFSILGYNKKERIILFFSLYFPIIILSILFSMPITLGIIAWFVATVNSSILISLSMSLTLTNILISSLIVLGIFSITTTLAWVTLNRIKPIILLKGD